MSLRRRVWLAAVAAVPVIGGASAFAASTPEARQLYAPAWSVPVVQTGPCLLSVVLPPSEKEGCSSWTRRETAGPVFHRGLGVVVVGGSDRALRALDAKDGHVRWRTPTRGAVVAQPTLVGVDVYAGTDDARVVNVDAASGRVRWEAAVDAEVTEPVVVEGDLVFVVTGADSVFALNKDTGEAQWVVKHPLPRGITLRGQARPLAVDVDVGAVDAAGKPARSERLYVGHADGTLTVHDRASGAQLVSLDLSEGDSFGDVDADPLWHQAKGEDPRVIVASQTRGIVSLDPKTHAVVWKNPEAGIVRLASGGAPLIIGAGAGKVVAIDAATGAPRWRFTWKKGAPTRIAVQGGRVHLGSDRGSVFVLDLFSGRPLQYTGSALGTAADLAVDDDMMFAMSAAGSITALSNAWTGAVHASKAGGLAPRNQSRWQR